MSRSQRHSVDAAATSPVDGGISPIDRNGSMPMPMGSNQRPFPRMQGEGGGMMHGGLPAAGPTKSNKNTQHVPCKFFLQGQCQAGHSCPFSHDVESTMRPAPCKYFAKGGCKFGRKCALLHVTPDGTVVNRIQPYQGAPQGGQYLAGIPSPLSATFGQAPPPPGLLSMQAQGLEHRPNGDMPPDMDQYPLGLPRNGYDLSQVDMMYASTSPKYGSPPQTERMANSPPHNPISVLDAPLPNSFDSNGISWAARHGPLASSVPSRFDVESPPSSLPRKPFYGGTALRDLRNSAFGDRGMDNLLASMGSSPPSGNDEPFMFEKRPLHSDRLRASRPMVSASLGARIPVQPFGYSDDDEDDDNEPDREEDLLPSSLHDLIPEGRVRKDSRSSRPASFLAAQRRTISSHGTPQDSKVGSPSRYTGMFAAAAAASRTQASNGAFGHVGSPLRDSGFSSSSVPRDLHPGFSSPPRQASMSMLTQELQRTKLDAARAQAGVGSSTTPAQPGSAATLPTRTLSNGSATRRSLDRGASSSSVGQQRIEEDQELFDMDGVGGPAESTAATAANSTTAADAARSVGMGTSPRGDTGFGVIGGQRNTK